MNFYTKFLLLVAIFFELCPSVVPQSASGERSKYIPLLKRDLKDSEIFNVPLIKKKPFHYTSSDWRQLIDEYWGTGLPDAQKLLIFDLAVNKIDSSYAEFQNLEINFDSIKILYRSEIEKGVSRGRFAAIMNHLSLALKEAHTIIADIPVNFGTEPLPGVPVMVIGPWQNNSRFGASLTVLPDSSLLVYRALPNHQLGLIAGDIVLGYDGIPWKELYKELLVAELPIHPMGVWGSTDKSLTHCILSSAGLNWHLFDTIDIIKYPGNDTIHLPTELLNKQTGFIWGNEQLSVEGVPFPDFSTNNFVYWGIINGTNIGYIYVTSWNPDEAYKISTRFYNAVDSIMRVYNTEGLILDFRSNNGGWMGVAHAGYSLLFNESIFSVAFDIRAGDADHFNMRSHPDYTKLKFIIPGDPSTFYNKPIAVLTGPGAISNGDFESWRMKLHPEARLFGKPSCGAFSTSILPDLNNNDWFFYLTYGNSYPVNLPGQYLTHTDLLVDEEVWLTRDGAAKGYDDVVNKAVEWIRSAATGIKDEINNMEPGLFQNYPNPFNPSTKIKYSVSNSEKPLLVVLKIFDMLGNEITTLVNEQQSPGSYEINWNAENLSSGVYFYRLQAGTSVAVKKMVLMK